MPREAWWETGARFHYKYWVDCHQKQNHYNSEFVFACLINCRITIFIIYLYVYVNWGCSRALIWASVEPCQVEGQPEVPPWLAVRDKILKIWTLRYSKNAFAESLVLLTVLSQLWKCVVFVMLHSSLRKFCNNVYKIM